jgi:cell division septal protein FtsQ
VFKLSAQKSPLTKGRVEKARSVSPRLSRQKVKRRPSQKPKGMSPAAKAFWKGLFMAFTMAVITLLVSGGLLAAYAALATHPGFQVKRAEIGGVKKLPKLEILRTAGIGSRTNILSLPVGAIEKKLTEMPWVRQAKVQRVLPDQVCITIKEYEPRQLALVEGGFYYLDAGMRAFAPMGVTPSADLPLLTGLTKADLVDPDDEIRALLDASLELLNCLPAKDRRAGGNLSEIHLDRVWGLSLVFSDLFPTVRIGRGDFKTRLARLEKVKSDLLRRQELKRVLLIDLSDERRVFVRLRGDSL